MSNESTTPAAVSADIRARLAAVTYLILPPSLGHTRRATIAHRNVSQALGPGLTDNPDQPLGPEELTRLRVRVLRLALGAGYRSRVPRPSLAARSGDAGVRDKALGALIPAARAAHALRRVEDVSREATVELLAAAGVSDPETAVRISERLNKEVPPLVPSALPSAAALRRRRHRVAGAFATAGVVLVGGTVTATGSSDSTDQVPPNSTSPGGAAAKAAPDAAPRASTAETAARRAAARQAQAAAARPADGTSAATRATARRAAEQAAATRAAQAAKAAQAARAAAAARKAAAAAAQQAEAAKAAPAASATAPKAVRAATETARKAAPPRKASDTRKSSADAERLRDPSLPEGTGRPAPRSAAAPAPAPAPAAPAPAPDSATAPAADAEAPVVTEASDAGGPTEPFLTS